MKKNITMLLFGLAISVGSWIAPALNPGSGMPAPKDMLKQEIAKARAKNADGPFGDTQPDPATDRMANVLAGTEPKPHPMNWGVVAGLAILSGGAVLTIRSLAAKAAESFPGGSDGSSAPARMEW